MKGVLLSLIQQATIRAISTGITPNRNGTPLNRPPCNKENNHEISNNLKLI